MIQPKYTGLSIRAQCQLLVTVKGSTPIRAKSFVFMGV